MNINNFEDYIDKTILNRGYRYYNDGHIIEVYKQNENEYTFIVEGNEEYEVSVYLNENGEIKYSDCDCPFDFGPICKHQVASFFQLLKILNNKTKEGDIPKTPKIDEILNNLSKEELISIILDITKNNKTIKNSIMFRYSNDNASKELERCKRLINSILSKYQDRDGSINYRYTHNFVSDMESILCKISNTEDIMLALDIAFLVLYEAIEALEYSDDSGGYIWGFILETIEVIDESVDKSKVFEISKREEIFNKLLEESDSGVFDGWEEFKIDVLKICTQFIDIEEPKNRLVEKIEYILSEDPDSEYIEYTNSILNKILLDINGK